MSKTIVVDAHHHFAPEGSNEKVGVADGVDFGARFRGGRSKALHRMMQIENTLRFMDDAGVDRAVLNQTIWSPMGVDFCRMMNDGYARVAKTYPDRFIPCAHLPLGGKSDILDELDRCVTVLGFRGVAVVSSTAEVTLDSESLYPLYEKVSGLDVPIVVHPSIRTPIWGGVKYEMSSTVSREYDIAKATVEVLYGVLPRFPGLKFIMPHFGGGMPNLKGRILAWFEPQGWDVPAEIKGHPKTPRELEQSGLDRAFDALFDRLYFDTAGFGGWMPIAESSTRVIRPDRLCFGTDYPFEIHEARDVKSFIENIKKLGVTEEEKSKILGGTILTLFKSR